MEMILDQILEAVRGIKVPVVRLESQVVDAIKEALNEDGIEFESEVTVAPRCRVDLFVEGSIVIEVKKGKPNSRSVAAQVSRYASGKDVRAVILVSERGLVHHITEAHGKPVKYVALSKNWGLST
jgi:hypothetical protein